MNTSPSTPDDIAKRATRALWLMLAIDVVVLLAYITLPHGAGHRFFDMTSNGGLAEVVGYVKQLVIVGFMVWLWRRTQQVIYLVWGAIFLILCADDAFRIHENVGLLISQSIHLPPFLLLVRGRDIGEILYLANMSVIFLLALASAWMRSSNDAKGASVDIAVCVAVLAVFGVGLDFVHEASRGPIKKFLGPAEDFGELVTWSFLAWLCYHLALSHGRRVPRAWYAVRELALSLVPKSRRIPRLASADLNAPLNA